MEKCKSWNHVFWLDIILLCGGSIIGATITTVLMKGSLLGFSIRLIVMLLGTATFSWFLVGKKFYSAKPNMAPVTAYKAAVARLAKVLGRWAHKLETEEYSAVAEEVQTLINRLREGAATLFAGASSNEFGYGLALNAYEEYREAYASAKPFGLQGGLPAPQPVGEFAEAARNELVSA